MVCFMLRTEWGVEGVAPPGLPLHGPAWLSPNQDHLDKPVLSSLVLFASVSSLSLSRAQHATRGHSGAMVAFLLSSDSAGGAGCQDGLCSADAPARRFLSAFAVPPCHLHLGLWQVSFLMVSSHSSQGFTFGKAGEILTKRLRYLVFRSMLRQVFALRTVSWDMQSSRARGCRWWGRSHVTLRSSCMALPWVSWGR